MSRPGDPLEQLREPLLSVGRAHLKALVCTEVQIGDDNHTGSHDAVSSLDSEIHPTRIQDAVCTVKRFMSLAPGRVFPRFVESNCEQAPKLARDCRCQTRKAVPPDPGA